MPPDPAEWIAPLRELCDSTTPHLAQWDRRAFNPFMAWDEITLIRRQMRELQVVVTTLIERFNG